jgi:ABC-type nitrate/sulfonate/bicarbonate transport system substrate-binding protein
MNLLLDMAAAGLAFPQSALMVKRSYLETNRERVSAFLKALIEGLYVVRKDRPLAIELFKSISAPTTTCMASVTTIS